MKIKPPMFCLLFLGLNNFGFSQTNSPSIQSGVTFQWSDTQPNKTDPATIESITVNGTLYYNFGVPSGYELTQLGSGGHDKNNIRLNGNLVESTSASATWDASALDAYQSLNLNHYFETNGNGDNICDDYTAEETSNAQRQTLSYGAGIVSNSSGLIAITERNSNNCYHLEFFGIPFGGTIEQSLGETFVNETSTQWGYGGTGTNGNNLGTPGTVNPPNPGTDYWLSDRLIENGGTIGIALFYLDDIAPFGSTITKVQLTSATVDDGDGKLFILTFPDDDKDSLSDIDDLDDDNDGITDVDESGGIDPSADHDIDGIPNYQDADFCTLNSSGICANLDLDSDGIPNHFDLDSDNDGLSDVFESGGTDTNFDALADGTIGLTALDFGVPSSAGTGTNPSNTDNTGNFDFLDIDSDDDGIPDNIEAQPTLTYIAPSGMGLAMLDANNDGIDDTYGTHGLYNSVLSISDTDKDGIYDYLDLDSDNDTIPDIQENGMPNTVSGNDSDTDGLDNNFETNGVNDSVVDVNEAIENPSDLSTLPDTDGDLNSGGDLDYRDLFDVLIPDATLDFDGIDDYLSGSSLLNGLSEVTIMAWVKIDPSNSGVSYVTIAGEDVACRLYVQNGNKLMFATRTNTGFKKTSAGVNVNYDEWHHITGTFSGNTGTQSIYVDGELQSTSVIAQQIGRTISASPNWNGQFEVGRLSQEIPIRQYFNGEIDEVRVFDKSLTAEQIQQMVYQEIENNNNNVKGKILPKDIMDTKTLENVSWNNLIAYYPMSDIKNRTTSDYSGKNNRLNLENITTLQEQTAPMPYVTSNDGNWIDSNIWLHGDVWDITEVNENKDWSIVKIKNNVTSTHSHTSLGLIIDQNNTITINGDHKVENSWYLELNGTLDLSGDSQLIQGRYSDLVTSAAGKILRRQEGNSSVYWYNYWASPVGAQQATSLINNNLNTSNTNNSTYKLNMLKKGDGSQVQFTNSYNETGRVSTRWLYTYKNGVTYYDYEALNQNSQIEPGIGYTQKGTGTTDSNQQFIFEGKPNNGTVAINVTDTGGYGSVPAVSKTDYLIGNPYPSAIDIHAFIDANEGVIDGTIHLWQQWSGTSHNLNEYDGGYAQVNKLGSVRAYQFVGIEGATNGNQDGTKVPTKYLPVGQGFMVEIVADGTIVFKNDQRVFIKESDANGNYNNGSTFFRIENTTANNDISEGNDEPQIMRKVRIEFSAVDGPATRRELLLGFSEFTSDGYDYGYDALNVDEFTDDLNLTHEDKLMMMQAYAEITPEKTVPLTLQTSGNFNYRIRATQFEDFDENQAIYLKDNQTGTYFDLKNDQAYEFSSSEGVFNNRFEIVFQEEVTLSIEEEEEYQYHFAYFNNDIEAFFLKGLQSDVKQFMIINILGQSVREYNNVGAQDLDNGLKISNLSTGTYVVYIKTANSTITKKILVK